MKKILLLTLALIFCFVGPVLAKEVTVDGQGASRDDAIRDALRLAVEQAVGTLVKSETLVQNAQVVKDEIYTKSQGYVEDYTVLNERRDNELFVLSVKVNVNTSPNSALMTKLQKLKLVEVGLRDPRIAVMIAQPQAEATIIRNLRENGFRHVLDASQVQSMAMSRLSQAITTGDTAQAKALAIKQGLDLVVVGTIETSYVGNVLDSGMHSTQAQVTVKVFKTDTAEILAANTLDAAGADITKDSSAREAVIKASNKAAAYLVEQFMQYAGDPEKPLTLMVQNVASFQQLNTLQAGLRQISGVKAIHIRNYQAGQAQVDITYTGSPQALSQALQNITGVKLEVTDMSGSTVTAVMK